MSTSSSWYQQNLKKLNALTARLVKYSLQGSYDQELNLNEIQMVLQNMAKEITLLQNELQEKNKIIGLLKIELGKNFKKE